MNTITMTEAQWNELKARIAFSLECMEILREEGYSQVKAASVDLRAQLAEIDDANTRAAYMALAADDQMSLFDVEGAAI